MATQPKYKPLQAGGAFINGSSARLLVQGTISRDQGNLDTELDAGRIGPGANDPFIDHFPNHWPTQADGPFPMRGEPLRRALLRGQRQFTLFCAMCHGNVGDGEGIIVRRGFTHPPTYHQDRLRAAPVGQFFDTITNGRGAMYGYGDRISPSDRWAIVEYIRALQASQAAPMTRGQYETLKATSHPQETSVDPASEGVQ